MAIITTDKLALNDADPKPVTGFDYAGQPIKPGTFYNGRPEHMGPNANLVSLQSDAHDHASTQSILSRSPRKKSSWTKEKREAYAKRMREYWAKRKLESGT